MMMKKIPRNILKDGASGLQVGDIEQVAVKNLSKI